MAFSTSDLPQADRLEKVIKTVEAVSLGHVTDLAIANYIGFTDRQGRYYRHAASMLGFVTNHNNTATITDSGKELVDAPDEETEKNILQQAVLNNPLFKLLLDQIKSNNEGLSRKDIDYFIYQNTSNPSESTISRRLTTLLQWLLDPKIELLLKNRINGKDVYIYHPITIETDEDTIEDDYYERDGEEQPSVYPINNYNFELDIRIEHITVFGLIRKWEQKKINMNPDFQRKLVWKSDQKSRFIESLILNIPLPPIYVSQDINADYVIVDGVQRTSTLIDFYNNKFALTNLDAMPFLIGKKFSDLPDELRARIEDKNLLLYVLKPSVPLVVIYDIFNRINTGGTQLTRQEIRNCIFIGKSTQILKDLSDNPIFKKSIDNGINSSRMKDQEAVLRCLSFSISDYKTEYKDDMDEFLGNAMRKINIMADSEVEQLKKNFIRVMGLTYDFFKEKNFRLSTEYSRGRINIAIMESVFLFFFQNTDRYLIDNKHFITHKYFNNLLSNELYLNSVQSSTGTTKKVINRFSLVSTILKNT